MNKQLHICCGDIYLSGYTNIDIKGKTIFEVPLWKKDKNVTTLDNYFKYPFGSPRREVIVDKNMNVLEPWDFEDNSVDEIVMISAIEHFTPKDAKYIISQIKRVLKPGGKLIIDFPDLMKQIVLYYDENPEFCMELIYCNQKDECSMHHWGYTRKSFFKFLGEGWEHIKYKTIVRHSYPMIGCIAIKEKL